GQALRKGRIGRPAKERIATMSTNADVAERWVNAMNRHDVEAAAALLAPGAVFWANGAGHGEIKREERLQLLSLEFQVLASFEWYDVKVLTFDGGCALRMKMRGRTKTASFDSAMCSFLFIAGGQISRVESYVNTADLGPLADALRDALKT